MNDQLPTGQHYALGVRASSRATVYGFAQRLGAWIFAAAFVHGLLS